jgi:hypothetical protein
VIYVLSGSRRETARWAESQGHSLRQARHVYDAQTLPGRIAGVRFVQLPGFETRRDRHAIVNRLKRANYRKIPVEIWREHADGFGGWYREGEPEVTPAAVAVEIPVEGPSDDTPTAEPEKTEPEQEAPAAEEETQSPTPSETDPLEQFLGLSEAPADEQEAPAAEVEDDEQFCDSCKAGLESSEHFEKCVRPARDAEEKQAEDESSAKPKRTRRTKAQMAYDAALADWEGNGGSLEAVIEARDALAAKNPDDERLLTAPQSDEEVEAQSEDDDALDF